MKVFQTSDYDWWLAASPDQARESAIALFECDENIYPAEDVRELAPDELERLEFVDEDGARRTFAQELARRLEGGASTPEMFASSEY